MDTQQTLTRTAVKTIDDRTIERVAELFNALSDPSRVRIIIALLPGEMNVGDIAAEVGMSSSAVSHQLRTLRQIRVVRTSKQGREVYYTLDDEHVIELVTRGLDHVKHG
jgi:DNA-binding transcriptional ArsR family regulator